MFGKGSGAALEGAARGQGRAIREDVTTGIRPINSMLALNLPVNIVPFGLDGPVKLAPVPDRGLLPRN